MLNHQSSLSIVKHVCKTSRDKKDEQVSEIGKCTILRAQRGVLQLEIRLLADMSQSLQFLEIATGQGGHYQIRRDICEATAAGQ